MAHLKKMERSSPADRAVTFSLTTVEHQRFYYRDTFYVTFGCPDMNFLGFPFDRHRCHFLARSGIPLAEMEVVPFEKKDAATGETEPVRFRDESADTILEYFITFEDLPEEVVHATLLAKMSRCQDVKMSR